MSQLSKKEMIILFFGKDEYRIREKIREFSEAHKDKNKSQQLEVIIIDEYKTFLGGRRKIIILIKLPTLILII